MTSAFLLAPSSRVRRTPYSARVESAGVKGYTVYNHTLLATAFRSLDGDYQHLKRHVQVWDVSCERQVEIKGPDAARLVGFMTPRDVSKAVVGQCVYAPLTDERGGIINDPVILKLADDRFWLSIADSDVVLWAKGLAHGFGFDVEIEEARVWPLAVQGPKSDAVMTKVFGEDVRDIRFFRYKILEFQGTPLLVARSGWSKQGGFELYLENPDLGEPLWDAIWEAGQDFNIGPGCPNLIERIEGGLLSYGADIMRWHNPLEFALDRFCHLDKADDFLGREALLEVRDEGVARIVRGVTIPGDPVPPCHHWWPAYRGGERIGHISSATYSPDFKTNVTFAMLNRGHWDAGTEIEVETPDGRRPGTVADLPFVG